MTERADIGRRAGTPPNATPAAASSRPSAQPSSQPPVQPWGRRPLDEREAQGPIIDPTTPPRRMSMRGAPVTAVLLILMLAIELLFQLDEHVLGFRPALREIATSRFAYLPADTLAVFYGGALVYLLQSVSYVMLHGSLLHVGFNAAAMAALGPPAERLCRPTGYLALVLLTGAAGAFTHFAWEYVSLLMGSPGASTRLLTPLVGASGAICGLLGFDLRRRAMALARIPRLRRWISPSRWLWRASMAFLAINLIVALSDSLISGAAHLGGFAAGLLLAPRLLRGRPLLDDLGAKP